MIKTEILEPNSDSSISFTLPQLPTTKLPFTEGTIAILPTLAGSAPRSQVKGFPPSAAQNHFKILEMKSANHWHASVCSITGYETCALFPQAM